MSASTEIVSVLINPQNNVNFGTYASHTALASLKGQDMDDQRKSLLRLYDIAGCSPSNCGIAYVPGHGAKKTFA